MLIALTVAGACFLTVYFVLFTKAVAGLKPEERQRLWGIGSFKTNLVITAGLLGIILLDQGWLRFTAATLLFVAVIVGGVLRSRRFANEALPDTFLRRYLQSLIAFTLAALSLLGALGLDVLR